MEPAADLTAMDLDQLNEALTKADEELQDVRYERDFVLGQTGVHIGAQELSRLTRSWERDETRLQERVGAIKARLTELQSAP